MEAINILVGYHLLDQQTMAGLAAYRCVDEIYCDNVLEHIGSSDDFIFVLNEFCRLLKPGAG